jgi:ATPase subunit of ABC transporter with duplicated ATPase domains
MYCAIARFISILADMGHVEVGHVSHTLPNGRVLLDDVSFRVGEGVVAALVGPNGAGKTTLLRLIAGDITPQGGTVSHSGGLGVMRQFIGGIRDSTNIEELLLSIAPAPIRGAAAAVQAAELLLMEDDDEPAQLRYADALATWGDVGGYEAENVWEACSMAAMGVPYSQCRWRLVSTLSGGEQKRLVLEALLRGPDQVLLLDEPDNYLDVPGKQWLETRLRETPKTVLLVSHDRELLNQTAARIVTVESHHVWIHGGRFETYSQARRDRIDRLEELRRRWDEDHAKLRRLVTELRQKAAYNDGMASRYQAAMTRLRMFEEGGSPEAAPRDQNIAMRLRGNRTGRRAVICEALELTGLMRPFDTEIWYGERVAVLGSNGSGKSHFLRLLMAVADDLPRGALPAEPVEHHGVARLGARVTPGLFAQTHGRPDLAGRTPCEIVMTEYARLRNEAMSALARYELQHNAELPFETLSGGQQARLQILLLELGGATLLLLDEPTDNLDLASAEALQHALEGYQGTVIAVTHDRWFAARTFDRFLVFGGDGAIYEAPAPVWDESRISRP